MELKVKEVSKKLGIDKLLDRKPGTLSGGEMQRVAVARALIKDPLMFLFDEPLSNLDANLRNKLREELRNLHKLLKVTTLYVTHDQTEAMSLGDRIVIIDNGKIQQIGTPQEIFNKPKNIFVAKFIGYPSMNILKAKIEDSNLMVGNKKIQELSNPKLKDNHLKIGIRPCDIILKDNGVKCYIQSYDYQGSSWVLRLLIKDQTLLIELGELPSGKMETINIFFPIKKILFFDNEFGNLLS
ncbi:MAG: hypothetical protein CBE24_00075 [bacterium TMED264]|nr:MAG: hypothetical protein CBE24_00075 [bacterium TMED264]